MTAVDDHPVERTDIPDPPKLLRLGSMIKNLLDEVHAMPLDERGRIRLVGIYAQAVAELRVGQAQLVGWLEGLFQGVQFASPAGNPFLFAAVATSLAATLAGIYLPGLSDLLGTTPLSGAELGLSVLVAAVPALLIELVELRRDETSAGGGRGFNKRAHMGRRPEESE